MEKIESPLLWYIRRPGFVIGAVAAIAGLVAWLSGWRYGHSLTTLALVVMIVGSIDWKYSPHFAAGRAYYLLAVKSREKDDYDGALSAVASSVKGFRRLAAKYPERAWLYASTLAFQWQLLDKTDSNADLLAVAEEAVAAWRPIAIPQ